MFDKMLVTHLILLCLFSLDLTAAAKVSIGENDLKEFIKVLWSMEENRIDLSRDLTLNTQGRIRNARDGDQAKEPLFSQIKTTEIVKKIPTITAFQKLLDNYETAVGKTEVVTPEEEREMRAFLDQIVQTPAMQKTYRFLKDRGIKVGSISQFKNDLYTLWFGLYRRTSPRDSSAFEHVFVGETKDGQIMGFHNWIQFAKMERLKWLDYRGYYAKTCGNPPRLVTISFTGNNNEVVKPRGSLLLGTSPEFEMALYTAVFMSGHQQVGISLGSCSVLVKCYPINGGRYIGTCYIQ